VNLHVDSSSNGAYDMFVCHDNTLVAVDDCCFPFDADTFVLDTNNNGRPTHVRHWELPWRSSLSKQQQQQQPQPQPQQQGIAVVSSQ
jgi:hypothetical protein